ncbi:alpha/beta hydrolase [Thalassotalea euphylliae]|uniref:alpha/beta hydrolase n=1 Tax=Thalassotalea euphylliae TaxID=1655234 RepID=UPI00363AC840
MSKQESNQRSKFLPVVLSALAKVLPGVGYSLYKKRLLTPKKVREKWSSQVRCFHVETPYGKVRAYRYGEGKMVWLVHGWSGHGRQFWPLMQKLAEQGYCAIAFDLPAHGYSNRLQITIPQLVRAFDSAASSLFEPEVVIAHGIGASVVANSRWFKRFDGKFVMAAPIVDPCKHQRSLFKDYTFNHEYFERFAHDILRRDRVLFSSMNISEPLGSFPGVTHIIHDKQDVMAPLAAVLPLAEKHNVELITTNTLGHQRILESRKFMKILP